ncbi:MAG: ATP-binding protein [Caulobacteraceae bacterium]|nr:ATP-binding protein [Caulobacteraceae bacterium]
MNGSPAADPAGRTSRAVALQSLDAQVALLPYALLLFGLALPVYGWICTYARDRMWMLASLAAFAVNWGAFYGGVDWLKRHPGSRTNLGLRTRVQILGGLLWAVTVAQIATVAAGAGLAHDELLMLAIGAAAICIFFSAPLLPALLIVGPTAAAAPLLYLFADPASVQLGRIALGAIALVMALSLIMNRLLRRQFALAAEREQLIEARAQSLARAEKLAKSKSDLLATLSHEIRNGLTGAAHVLAAAAGAGGRSAPSREQLTAALGAAEDLLTVLDATLDMETAQSGRLAIEPQPFDLPRLAHELALLNRPLAATKGLELSIHVDEELATGEGAAVADPARVRQILANLLGNAIKYTVRGRIELRLARTASDRIRLEVVDTGPGLTPDELDAAFEPFSRIKRTAAGVPGAGLGLPLARHLAQLMGGDVTAESAVGIGCCLRLDLRFDPDIHLGAPDEALAPTAPAQGLVVQALRVLVAEDDALHAAMLRSVLEQLGHHVLQAHDGQRACELAQICEVDLIMLAGRLPVLDGPQATRAIRRMEGPAARTPIIAIIGGDSDEATACLEAGASQVLRKPMTVGGVARALAAAMRQNRLAPARLRA